MGKKDFRMYENLALVSQIGIMMVIPIIGGLFLGKYLDDWLHTSPLFLLIMILVGVLSSFMNLYRFTMSQSKKGRRK